MIRVRIDNLWHKNAYGIWVFDDEYVERNRKLIAALAALRELVAGEGEA